MSLHLRPALPSDKALLFEWRNHPNIRLFSSNPEKISWPTHEVWFEEMVQSKQHYLLVAEADNSPIGCLRYDLDDHHSVRANIYLAPHCLGQGWGSRILTLGTDWLKQQNPNVTTIVAWILSKNQASLRAFSKAGFKKKTTQKRHEIWEFNHIL